MEAVYFTTFEIETTINCHVDPHRGVSLVSVRKGKEEIPSRDHKPLDVPGIKPRTFDRQCVNTQLQDIDFG